MNGTRWSGAAHLAADESGFGLVEILITMLIMSVGLLALTTISAGVASQTRISAERTAQAMATQQVLEDYTRRGYAAAASRVDTVQVSGRRYIVTSSVTDVNGRVRQVSSVVDGRGLVASRTYITRIYDPIALP